MAQNHPVECSKEWIPDDDCIQLCYLFTESYPEAVRSACGLRSNSVRCADAMRRRIEGISPEALVLESCENSNIPTSLLRFLSCLSLVGGDQDMINEPGLPRN